MTRVVSESELRAVIGHDAGAYAAVEQAYIWLRARRVSMPPVFHIDIDPQSAVDVKGAYVDGVDCFAIKMASGFNGNPARGLPSSSSVILLLSAETGLCQAVFLDNGYLMNIRTALAGAVATHHLARTDAKTVGIVGTGVQAREQLSALMLKRAPARVLLWGRNADRAEVCAREMSERTEARIDVQPDLERLVRLSDILITTTPSTAPLIMADWVQPGTHITAMGSDLPGKAELEVDLLTQATLIVCDDIAQCEIGGEVQRVPSGQLSRPPVTLSQVISGKAGRRSDGDITICDMTGLGVLDTAIACEAFGRLRD